MRKLFGYPTCKACGTYNLPEPHIHVYDEDEIPIGAACSEACAIQLVGS